MKDRIGLKLNQMNTVKIVKIAIGSTLAILVADLLGLKYSSSAGIITLLSIVDTKKDTLQIAYRRVIAFFIGLLIALCVFTVLGYDTISFGTFLLIFITACYSIRLQDGVSMCAVLTTHFLNQKSMSYAMIGNEFALLLIGVGAGIMLNMYMPNTTKVIKQDMRMMEQDMKTILRHMATYLNRNYEKDNPLRTVPMQCLNRKYEFQVFSEVEKHMNDASQRAYQNMNNNLIADTRYYIQYTQMRKSQLMRLKQVYYCICRMTYIPKQATSLAKFILEIEGSFHEYNNVEDLLHLLEDIRKEFKAQEIPMTRIEFENRAILYQMANELEEFLRLKHTFVAELSIKQIETFWEE